MSASPDIGSSWEGLRAALVIAHPGHELRVHHWLERTKPQVFVLTDGSGHTDRSRLGRTTALLAAVGAVEGPLFGRLTDRQLYQAILALDEAAFDVLAQELASALEDARIDYVVGDAVEGVNPGHDVCRLIINAAVMRLEAATGRRLANFEFAVEGPPDTCPAEERDDAIVVRLDQDAYRRKVAAARAYAEVRSISRGSSIITTLMLFASSVLSRCAMDSRSATASHIRRFTKPTARNRSQPASTPR